MAKPAPGHCHYCGIFGPLTRDHIIPKARGGTNETWNLVGSCQPCNGRKADDLPTCRCDRCQQAIDRHWQWIMQQPFRSQSAYIDRVGLLYASRFEIPPGYYPA